MLYLQMDAYVCMEEFLYGYPRMLVRRSSCMSHEYLCLCMQVVLKTLARLYPCTYVYVYSYGRVVSYLTRSILKSLLDCIVHYLSSFVSSLYDKRKYWHLVHAVGLPFFFHLLLVKFLLLPFSPLMSFSVFHAFFFLFLALFLSFFSSSCIAPFCPNIRRCFVYSRRTYDTRLSLSLLFNERSQESERRDLDICLNFCLGKITIQKHEERLYDVKRKDIESKEGRQTTKERRRGRKDKETRSRKREEGSKGRRHEAQESEPRAFRLLLGLLLVTEYFSGMRSKKGERARRCIYIDNIDTDALIYASVRTYVIHWLCCLGCTYRGRRKDETRMRSGDVCSDD